jgi:hypothetical protein
VPLVRVPLVAPVHRLTRSNGAGRGAGEASARRVSRLTARVQRLHEYAYSQLITAGDEAAARATLKVRAHGLGVWGGGSGSGGGGSSCRA